MAEYRCSRMTVNKALSSLATAGLIMRQRRLGSFVSQPRIHMAALQIPDIREEIEKRGFVYALRLISRAVLEPDSPAGEMMPVPNHGKLLSVHCLHVADGKPYATEHRLINLTAVPGAIDADFAATPPGTWLLQHVPWTEAEHRIGAVAAGEEADLLKIPRAAACLSLERRTWRHSESITYVRHVFKGENFDLTARFVSLTQGE
jgi:GntR family histidine utilization transcriptional repressor